VLRASTGTGAVRGPGPSCPGLGQSNPVHRYPFHQRRANPFHGSAYQPMGVMTGPMVMSVGFDRRRFRFGPGGVSVSDGR
jgi:hypothetical protein